MHKFLALTLAALVGSTTFAAADSTFSLPQVQDDDSIVELGPVTADGAGFVHIYALDAGKMGALIGSEAVHAGSNSDVRVPLIDNPKQDAMAVLEVGGQVVATQEVRFNG
ncbi:hypothetical protein Rumeso_02348 [Rubellimicrobium mesophilum DSM 19309]|uniref:Uncharacterized protein n=1 Tax=Rubellimicrobium mesophilum DSM 19309 TaxID=442562 RepID=A0A017HNZ7_9RHOB|nr:hypothetical protein [Rubellimicrobium mesophilum]EYD76076.1 hypothetical protein Rumeso_02348 [Rubellimicrobium mesophilum DSM 19309]